MDAMERLTSDLDAIDPASADYEGDVFTAMAQFRPHAILDGIYPTSDPDVLINPHFVHDGVRVLAKVGAWLGLFYGRHKASIDPFLDAALVTAFTTLLNKAAELRSLNNRGPT
jgi:hypothetical protein